MQNRQTLRFALASMAVLALLGGCASGHLVISDGRLEARAQADREQQTADALRRDGAAGAAAPAQARADERYDASIRKPSVTVEYLLDLLFHSWLNSGK